MRTGVDYHATSSISNDRHSHVTVIMSPFLHRVDAAEHLALIAVLVLCEREHYSVVISICISKKDDF